MSNASKKVKRTAPAKVQEFTVDRSKWQSGDLPLPKNQDPSLLDDRGMMCCLGFYMRSCGKRKADIHGWALPTDVPGALPSKAAWLNVRSDEGLGQTAETQIATINDNANFTRRARERYLRDKFRKHGVRVHFVGRTPRIKQEDLSDD